MKMRCPYCGLGGTVEESFFGKKVRCPGCLDIFGVSDEVLVNNAVKPERDYAASEKALPKKNAELRETGVTSGQDQLTDTEIKRDQAITDSGLGECSICGFSFSSAFIRLVDDKLVCPACAG
jgi:DNA-directed RNA polymerase subunit RPC12/RpoP